MKKTLKRGAIAPRITPPRKTGAGGRASGSVRSFPFRDGQPEALLSLKDLSRLFAVHPKTVARWLRAVDGCPIRPTRRSVRYGTVTLTILASVFRPGVKPGGKP